MNAQSGPVPGFAALKPSRDRYTATILTVMTAVALAVAMWSRRGINPLRSDSASYLSFDPSRTVSYPAFISLVRFVTGDVRLVVPAQMVLLAASFLLLGWSFHKFSRRRVVSILFQGLLVSSVELWRISGQLLTEALATACVALWCAQVFRTLRAPSLSGTGLLVAISAIGTMVRPSLAGLFAGAAVFVIAVQPAKQRFRAFAMIVAGFIGAWSATPIAHYFASGSAMTTSPFARGILQHTLFCDPRMVPNDPDSQFVEESAGPVRRYVEAAPPGLRLPLERTYSGQLRFGLIIPVLGRRHHFQSGWQTDPIISRIAIERVEGNPLCYAESVIAADVRMATYAASGRASRMSSFLAAHPPPHVPAVPLLGGDERDALRAAEALHSPPVYPVAPSFKSDEKSPALLMIAVRILFGGAAVLGLLAMFALPIRQRLRPELSQALAVEAASGAVFHGVIGITAIVELGLSRYSVPIWPAMCVLLGTGVVALLEGFARPSFNPGAAPPVVTGETNSRRLTI